MLFYFNKTLLILSLKHHILPLFLLLLDKNFIKIILNIFMNFIKFDNTDKNCIFGLKNDLKYENIQ